MDNREVLIRYNIDEIFACKEDNCLLVKDLEMYCSNKYKNIKTIIDELIKPMDDVTKSRLRGINPNDIALKNTIRDYLNKLNQNNYDKILKDLKNLNYTCENHFRLLITELIIKSMNDVMACKGADTNKNLKTLSEIYMNVAHEFSQYFIKHDDKIIKFKVLLTTECEKYFKTFTNESDSMDQNNPHRVSNYKGFMNMIGLMYTYNMLPSNIICGCFDKIANLVLNKNINQEERDNYYSGYDRLMNKLLTFFENCPNKKQVYDKFKKIKDHVRKKNSDILNECNNNSEEKPIRKFSIMVHNQNIARFEKLNKQYKIL